MNQRRSFCPSLNPGATTVWGLLLTTAILLNVSAATAEVIVLDHQRTLARISSQLTFFEQNVRLGDTIERIGDPDVVFPFADTLGFSDVDGTVLTDLNSSLLPNADSSGVAVIDLVASSFADAAASPANGGTDGFANGRFRTAYVLEVIGTTAVLDLRGDVNQVFPQQLPNGAQAKRSVNVRVAKGDVLDENSFQTTETLYNLFAEQQRTLSESFLLPVGNYWIVVEGEVEDELGSPEAPKADIDVEMTFTDAAPIEYRWDPVDAGHVWSTEQNWNPDGLPRMIDTVIFERSGVNFLEVDADRTVGAIQVRGQSTSTFWSSSGNVTQTVFGDTLVVGQELLDDATLSIDHLDVQVGAVTLGATRGAQGKVVVGASGSLAATGSFRVGEVEKAELEINSGGTVSAVNMLVAKNFGNDSRVKIDGGSLLVSNLVLGNGSPASLDASNGASVQASGLVEIDYGSQSRIKGLDTVWNSRSVTLKQGVFEIADLAEAKVSDLYVETSEDDSRVVVKNGAMLSVSGEFSVGDASLGRRGVVEISDRAEVSAKLLTVAGTNRTLLEINNSILAVTDSVVVGDGQTGVSEMTVENASSVFVEGDSTAVDAFGQLQITGEGTTWTQRFGDLKVRGFVSVDASASALFDNVEVGVPAANDSSALLVTGARFEALDRIEVNGLMSLQDAVVKASTEVLVHAGARLEGTGEVDTPQLHGDGYIAPGLSPGKLVVSGAFALSESGVLELEIGGNAETQFDVVDVAGDITLDGTVVLKFIDGFAPKQGDVFDLLKIGGEADLSKTEFQIKNLDPSFLFDVNTVGGNVELAAMNDGVFRLFGDFNGNGLLDGADMDRLSEEVRQGSHLRELDLTGDGLVDQADREFWVKNREVAFSHFGDSNLDGEFNSGDLVGVFTAGKYETGQTATWSEGDWNGNGDFDSGDLVAAFTDGGYEQGPQAAVAAVPEPTSILMLMVALIGIAIRRRQFVS